MSDDETSTFSITPRRVVDFAVDRLPLTFSVPAKLALGTFDDQTVFDNATTVAKGLQPVLSVLAMMGAEPKQMRVNPPVGATPFSLDFGADGEIQVNPAVDKITHVAQRFSLFGDLGTIDGVEIDFHLSTLPFYAADIIARWWQIIDEPGNSAYETAAIAWAWEAEDDNGAGTEGVWQIEENNYSPAPANIGEFATRVEDAAKDFARKLIDYFCSEAEAKSYSYAYSIGLSGLLIDPDHWLHHFRWGETAFERKSRVGLVDAIGRLIWRGLTGPTLTGSGGVVPANATDGPAKVKAFLYATILQLDPTGTNAATPGTAVTYLASGIAMYRARSTAITEEERDKWKTTIGEAEQLLGLLAIKLAADYERIKVIPDGTFPNAPPPKEEAILKLSVAGLVELLVNRGFFSYEADRFLDQPGTGTEGFELRSSNLAEPRLRLLQFMAFWDDRADDARAVLSQIQFDLKLVHACLTRINGYNLSQQQMADAEALATGFDHQDTVNFRTSASVMEVVGWVETAIDEAEHILARWDQETIATNDAIDVWNTASRAIHGADRLFQYARESWELSYFATHFLDGFMEGLNEELARLAAEREVDEGDDGEPPDDDLAAEVVRTLLRRHLEAIPTNTLFPQIMATGVIVGAGDYLWKNFKSLDDILNHPFDFVKSCIDVIKTIYDAPNDVVFFHMGKGLGIEFAKNMDNLANSMNSITFLFNLGRIFGPLIIEELLSLIFEAYVLVPVANKLRTSLRLVLNPTDGPVDEFVTALRRADFGEVTAFKPEFKMLGENGKALDAESFDDDGLLDDITRDLDGWDPDNPAFDDMIADSHHLTGPEDAGPVDPAMSVERLTARRVQEARIQIETQLSPARIAQAEAALAALP